MLKESTSKRGKEKDGKEKPRDAEKDDGDREILRLSSSGERERVKGIKRGADIDDDEVSSSSEEDDDGTELRDDIAEEHRLGLLDIIKSLRPGTSMEFLRFLPLSLCFL